MLLLCAVFGDPHGEHNIACVAGLQLEHISTACTRDMSLHIPHAVAIILCPEFARTSPLLTVEHASGIMRVSQRSSCSYVGCL